MMGRSAMPGDVFKHPTFWFAVAVLASMQVAGSPAAAQLSQYISNNPSVVVDTDVLESLGGGPAAAEGIAAADPRPPVVVQRAAPVLLPPPATAPRSRLNEEALARLGLTREAPAVARVAPAPKPAPPQPTAAITPPTSPTVLSTPRAPSTERASRPAPQVPARPVLPQASAPMPAVAAAAQTASRAAVPPPPPAAIIAAIPPPKKAAEAPSAARVAAVPTDQAAAPVAAATRGDDGELRLLFEDGSARLPESARARLQSLTEQLTQDEALKVQLVAYAAGTAQTSSQARRLSLSRALAVRSYLIDKGVRSTRMDIRALGNKAEDGPADRVDVVLVGQ